MVAAIPSSLWPHHLGSMCPVVTGMYLYFTASRWHFAFAWLRRLWELLHGRYKARIGVSIAGGLHSVPHQVSCQFGIKTLICLFIFFSNFYYMKAKCEEERRRLACGSEPLIAYGHGVWLLDKKASSRLDARFL